MKKLINRVEDVLSEQLAGLAKAYPTLTLHQDPVYVTRADAPFRAKWRCCPAAEAGMSRCTVAILGGECSPAPAPAKYSPRRRRIKCLSAPCRLTAAKACC